MLLPLPDSVQRPSRYCSESPAPFLERLPRLKTGVDAWAPVQSRELSIRALFFTGCEGIATTVIATSACNQKHRGFL
eukprot:s2628_g13.t1